MGRTPIAAAMTTKAIPIPADLTIAEALAHIAQYEYTTFPVVESSGRFAGFVSRVTLFARRESGGGDRPVVEAVSRADYVLPQMTLHHAAVHLNQIGAHVIAVVDDAETRKFLGILTSSDIVRAQATSELDETITTRTKRASS
jgi:CBS domain-containing protein